MRTMFFWVFPLIVLSGMGYVLWHVWTILPFCKWLKWIVVIVMAFCTVGMYLLQIQALKRLSAFTVNLTYNLEPCYTIILAFLIFGEGREINFSFYLGIALILISVLLQTWRVWDKSHKKTISERI